MLHSTWYNVACDSPYNSRRVVIKQFALIHKVPIFKSMNHGLIMLLLVKRSMHCFIVCFEFITNPHEGDALGLRVLQREGNEGLVLLETDGQRREQGLLTA